MATSTAEVLVEELEQARRAFHEDLDSMSAASARSQSLNPGWTNGEVMSHIAFGFIIVRVLLPMARAWSRLPASWSRAFAGLLNALTGPFNWVNGLGARGQAKVFTRDRLGSVFDRAHASLTKMVESIPDAEWQRGMYFPARWDPNFKSFMTLQDLVRYPIAHLALHHAQLNLPAPPDRPDGRRSARPGVD